jgi:hypothetical protein
LAAAFMDFYAMATAMDHLPIENKITELIGVY